MRNTGIPWAFTYGNHDTESYAASSRQSLNELYKSLSRKTSRTLMYPYVQPEITGRNNQLIELRSAEAGHTVPSLVFFHIPLQQYRTAYELWQQGSDEVTYHFGTVKKTVTGLICCSEYPSALFDAALELGSTTGFFCGHDHYNNFSIDYRGIRLTYGMSIDYLADPGIARDTAQRGGTLITVHEDGSTDIAQVPLVSIPVS